jgi:hypothetical protein
MQPCHYVRGLNGERVLIPGCWGGVMDGRWACHCVRDKTTVECLEERIEQLERRVAALSNGDRG